MEQKLHKISIWQIFILVISVYVLIALLIETVFSLSPETSQILIIIDNIICVIFILDFFYHLITAENKLRFLKWGWIDLVSSIPYIPQLRIGRLVRVIRIIRILRSIRSTRQIIKYLFENRAKSAFITVVMVSLLQAAMTFAIKPGQLSLHTFSL